MEIIFLFTFVKTAEILPTRNTAPRLFVLMFLFFCIFITFGGIYGLLTNDPSCGGNDWYSITNRAR